MIAGLELALAVGADCLSIRSDSQLVIGQVNAKFESRDPQMAKYVSLVKHKLSTLSSWKLEHVPRDSNERVDALAVVAASLPIKETIYLFIYYQPGSSILRAQVSQIEEVPSSWMDPIWLYIATGELPNDRGRAHKVQIKSARFSLVDEQLYKRSLGGPYLKCLTLEQGQYVLAELHEGICGNHPVQDLVSISSPWPFAQWGIDIMGPLPPAPAQKKLLLVATDYFNKLIEADAFASIKDRDITRFI